MQCKQLKHFTDLIPTDSDSKTKSIPIRLYTQMFKYFVRQQDLESFCFMITKMPTFVINHDELIKSTEPFLKDEKFSRDPNLLESLFRLYSLSREYVKAFNMLVKKQDKKVFDFLDRQQIDFPLNKNLGKLLRIDATRAVMYILKRYGRLQGLKIVDTCVQELQP